MPKEEFERKNLTKEITPAPKASKGCKPAPQSDSIILRR